MASGYPTGQAAYQPYIDATSAKFGVPADLLAAQIGQESGFNPGAPNGIAQFKPETAQQFGIDPTDPYQSIAAAGAYDAQLYQQTGSWTGALAAYGTIPKSSTDYTSGQASVANIAGAYDMNNPSAPGNVMSTAQPDPNAITVAGVPSGLAQLLPAQLGSMLGLNSASSSLTGATNFFIRVIVGIVGIAILIVGMTMLRPVQNVVAAAAKAA